VLRTRGEISDTIDRSEKGVTEHANNEPADMADDGDTNVSLSAGIHNNDCNENCGTEATQDLHQYSQVDTVRPTSGTKPFVSRFVLIHSYRCHVYVIPLLSVTNVAVW